MLRRLSSAVRAVLAHNAATIDSEQHGPHTVKEKVFPQLIAV